VGGLPTTALISREVAALKRSSHRCDVIGTGVVQVLFAEFVWAGLSATRFRLLSMEAAALILAR
jgi:hypothetical protein